MRTIRFFISIIYFVLLSCNTEHSLGKYERISKEIQLKYAPDSRTSIYSVLFENKNDTIFIKGETNNKLALNELLKKLNTENAIFKNEVSILPDKKLIGFSAIVNNSVGNIRRSPKHSAELVTQAILGTELKVYKHQNYFYLVQTPDEYISWIDEGAISLKNEEESIKWKHSKKIIYTELTGSIYKDLSFETTISDIVLGAQLKCLGESEKGFKIEFPDGRIGFVKKQEADLYSNWIKNVKPSQELIEHYSLQFLGFPYLWGGTSSKGVDCSGFVKTVYLMNGFVIPRDASQQINSGKIVDKNLKFEHLQKGDLMFFGTKATNTQKQRVTHVGIWLGNGKKEIIHASGRVRLNSADKNNKNYSEYLVNHYLGSRRYLGIQDSSIIDLKEKSSERLLD